MKNLFLLATVLLGVLASCSGPSSSELKQKNDSLILVMAAKDRAQNDLVNSLVEIDENLSQIKEKENIITLNAAEAGTNPDIKERINKDIKLIYDLMVQNQEKIAKLEKQLKSTNVDNANMKKLIASLNEQIREKTEEIMRLNDQLKEKNIEIESLNLTLGNIRTSLDSVSTVSRETADKLTQTTDELYTAYYVIGTSKELASRNIINKEGFLNTKTAVLKKDFDAQYFTEVDIRQTDEVVLYKKKVKVLTNHPQSSYELKVGDDENLTLVILNKNEFWSVSKYLVIQVN
ncbi:hypothetical protein LX69_00206 [Breznakibacter xylanolyticus]|uniref:Lipoprotein n=1 Tax=Breznakibacter xylanolyticus TaxID=990 RepID=A0A2W7NK08_9BACT|nr:hypothetical protein [Breznakibacter xylanolyticus]PZX20781.1 hypothetical protein LX69_00206 [Breznakibacter xylanolyticus]